MMLHGSLWIVYTWIRWNLTKIYHALSTWTGYGFALKESARDSEKSNTKS